jgi:hypothetical protein
MPPLYLDMPFSDAVESSAKLEIEIKETQVTSVKDDRHGLSTIEVQMDIESYNDAWTLVETCSFS